MTEAEYRAAIDRLSEVWDAPYDTPEGDERDRLADAVHAHEVSDGRYPLPPPSAEVLRMKREGIVAVRRPESDTP